MQYEFTAGGRRFEATPESAIEALRGVEPDPVRQHSVDIGGVEYPLHQAFIRAFALRRRSFNPSQAWPVFGELGFMLHRVPKLRRRPAEGELPPDNPPYARWGWSPDLRETMDHGPFYVYWCWWQWWQALAQADYVGGAVEVPIHQPGVYEVKRTGESERLVIGRTSDLNGRIRYDLVRGRHVAGRKIREHEDLSRLVVRWALTDRPAAAEEELHQRHLRDFGRLPLYTEHT